MSAVAAKARIRFEPIPNELATSTNYGVETRSRAAEYAALIARIAQGCDQALTTLYDSTSRLVFGLVLRIVNDRNAAEEVLLDVYTQVWRQAARYNAERGTPLSWLMTIARTRAIDRRRSERPASLHEELTGAVGHHKSIAPNPEAAAATSEMQEIVRSALAMLTREQREVIELSYYSGMSQSEIALDLGLPLGTVKTRTRMAMIKLRDRLKGVLGDAFSDSYSGLVRTPNGANVTSYPQPRLLGAKGAIR